MPTVKILLILKQIDMNRKKAIALACVVFIGGYFIGNDNGKQTKVKEIKNTMTQLEMDWYHWQDVESIIENRSINGDVIVLGE
ncbi:hypothetical protein DRO61_10395 [Candidatus Bathyarchaeota archaeon]|nr:MAG: hypothetical protein DRO61_10395 [Candidatus Bathyarchaeota archaeon]